MKLNENNFLIQIKLLSLQRYLIEFYELQMCGSFAIKDIFTQ